MVLGVGGRKIMYSAEGASFGPGRIAGHPSDMGQGAVTAPRPGRPTITTGDPILDRFLGPFRSSTATLIDSAHPYVLDLEVRICVRTLADLGEDVVFVDGGNAFDPYSLMTHARRAGVERGAALDRVRVARAFTAHQMTSILHDTLIDELSSGDASPRTVVISCLPDLYLDRDVWPSEAVAMLGRALARVREATKERDLITVITNLGLSKLASRRGLRRLVESSVDRVIRLERGDLDTGVDGADGRSHPWAFRHGLRRATRGVMTVTVPREGKAMAYRPVPGHQRVLDEFGEMTRPHEEAVGEDDEEGERCEAGGGGGVTGDG